MTTSTRDDFDAFSQPCFSLKNRLARLLWSFVEGSLFRFSPSPFHRWRAFLLRCFGAKIGQGAHVYPGVNIWAPWNLEVGEQAGIASSVILYNQAFISIGRRAVVSQGASLCTGTHDYTDAGFPLLAKPIRVGDHAWIASEAFIHPGVVIHEGAVIGARSVVTKDMPAWTVCAGHPCIPLKPRVMRGR